MRHLAIAALPLLLAACSAEAPVADDPAGEEAAAGDTGAMPEATLDLQATGIIVPAQGGFEQYDVPFGSNRAATEATLGNIVGAATGMDAGEGDCWLQTTTYDGLTLSFEDDMFVGYFAHAPYVPELTRAEMLADPVVTLVDGSTLGEEFTIGTGGNLISGLFGGPGDTATVEALWAGENCIFR